MRIVTTRELDITDGQDLQVFQLVQTRAMNGKQNRPDKAAAGHTDDDEHAEEAKEEEAIQGAVVQDVVVVNGKEGLDPVEPSIGELRTLAPAASGCGC